MRLLFGPIATLGFASALVAAPALAQQPIEYPAPCDEAKVSHGDHDRAHTVFLSGKEYLEESNYDKAISYFMDAYSIDCSVHAMLPIIATAYERKGDKSEAIHALGEYLKRAPNAPDHEIIEHRIRNLRDQLSREQPAPTVVPPPAAPPPQPTAAPAPSVPPPVEPQPAAGPAPTPPPSSPESTSAGGGGGAGALPWVVVGLGGAAAVTGIVMVAVGAGDVSDASKSCPSHICMTDAQKTAASKKQSDGYTLENAGGAIAIVGGLALVGGLVWGIVDSSVHKSSSAHVTPILSPGYGGVAFDGAF